MLRCVCGRGTFETHLRDNRRNPAALANPFFRLGACQGGFDNFDGCGRYIVFRPQGDDGTAAVKNISNELESGGAHQTVGINAQGDVVNGLATMYGFGNHELFVFRPSKLCRQWRSRRASVLRGSMLLQRSASHGVYGFSRGALPVLLS